MKTYAVIPSAGKGIRLGSDIPKQYLQVNGKEIIAYTLEIFQNCDLIDEIIIPASEEYFETLQLLKERYKLTKITSIIKGGETRQHSVYNAIMSKPANGDDIIVVHDAVRPLLTEKILTLAILEARKNKNVIVAEKVKDTLVEIKQNNFNYLDRENIYSIQTPQIFSYKVLKHSLEKAMSENYIGTDESMLVKKAGYEIHIVEGSRTNFKITTQEDIELFEKIKKP
ncbi:MAG: 2-C-methyl-D-erythritol 4-phosphate cytidylyltransferase [Ignavibacteriales bacterium]|nr:2-C-methyl-D-erythritol 4-phosphate cytidylyltransferase [Ignavibacteriales bacterium]